ncbi:hypothetical protein ACERII_22025 [Evansella sp. AB-rgal1]|uniref:hypothetical protein n=1 Tax=Evansella sp. AB-rgal1 TaxID=3242696 RepID=UPI00359DEFA1
MNGILTKHGMDREHLVDNFESISGVIIGGRLEDPVKEEKFLEFLRAGKQVLV